MKVCVLLILPILITSKNFLIETKDSMEAKGEEVNTEDDTLPAGCAEMNCEAHTH